MAESFWRRLTKSTLKNGDKQQKAKYPVWSYPTAGGRHLLCT